jgi:hypothetical protein
LHDLSDPAVHQLTARILARPEFAAVNPAMPSWVDSFLKLSQWLRRLELLHDAAPALYWVIVGGAGLIGLGLVAHMIWILRIAMSAPAPPSRGLTAGHAAPDLMREAGSLAASGRYLEAAHCLMIASFHALANHSIIELRPDRSNQWIRGALRKSPLAGNLADEVDALVVRTERNWFGGRENDPELYSQWLAACARIAAEVR